MVSVNAGRGGVSPPFAEQKYPFHQGRDRRFIKGGIAVSSRAGKPRPYRTQHGVKPCVWTVGRPVP